MGNPLFFTKSFDVLSSEVSTGEKGLSRVLTAGSLTTLGIGAIIGAGIFVLSGQVAANYAGPAIVFSFILSGLACAFAGLCYAEFASMIPVAGSAYTYSYATLGEFFAWIIGWDLILEYLFAGSTVAVGWSGYVVSFLRDFGLVIPVQFTNATGTVLVNVPEGGWQAMSSGLTQALAGKGIGVASLPHCTALFNLPAMAIVLFVTLLLVIGIKQSSFFNNLMVAVKMAAIVLFIVVGIAFIKTFNWHPFIPPNTGEFGHFGWSGVLRGAGVIFFAYIGFDAVSTAAQEAKNPKRDVPIGILGSLSICTVLYIMVAIVLTGVVSYTLLNVPDPIAVGVDAMGAGMQWLRPIIKCAAIAGLSSVILVLLLAQPRIFFSMANDGLLPPAFAKVHSRFRTPYISQLVTGLFAIILSGVLPINKLGELVSIGTLLAFVIVCASVIVLRKKRPDLDRPFKTPFSPVIPVLGVIACAGQMASLPVDTWLRLIIWMAIGLVVYFGYSVRHSKVRNQAKAGRSPGIAAQ